MELVNDFTVNADIDETWKTLIDLELIAPCMPGAELTEIEGEIHRGLVKVKVGPITAKFKGEAHFVERDADARRAQLKADGRDTGGKGNAAALITAQLTAVDDATTKVVVTTDLTITGKVAQFGRGALVDVSDKLLKQFVHNLETTVLNQGAAANAGDADTTAAGTSAPGSTGAATGAAAATAAAAATGTADAGASGDAASFAPPADAPVDGPPAPAAGTEAPAAEAPKIRKIESKPAEPIDLLETAGTPMLKRLAPVLAGLVVLLLIVRRRRR
ncbi:MAG: SRPBCC family protein [Ilumatobacteraceae bacterium]